MRLLVGLSLYAGGGAATLLWIAAVAMADTALLHVDGPAAPALDLGAGVYEIREVTSGGPPTAETTVFALETRAPLPLVDAGAGRAFEVRSPGIYVIDLRSEGGPASVHQRERLVLSPTLIFALAVAPLAVLPGLFVIEAGGSPRGRRPPRLGGASLRLASVRRRLVAVVGDLAAIAALLVVLLLVAPLFSPVAPLFPLAPVAYVWWGNSRGSTAGRWLAGIRVVNAQGAAPGIWAGLLRSIGWALSWGLLGGGYLIALLGDAGRAPHDALAGTFVVEG